jgi:hypothetical protein
MAETPHTPGPWATDPECGDRGVLGPDGLLVADCMCFDPSLARSAEINRANAAFIVRARNAHEALVAALEELVDRTKNIGESKFSHRATFNAFSDAWFAAKDALAHAKGEQP